MITVERKAPIKVPYIPIKLTLNTAEDLRALRVILSHGGSTLISNNNRTLAMMMLSSLPER
jgi:hypothetical protein